MSVKKLKKIKSVGKKHADISDEIMPLSEMPDYSSILLYGEAGTGKTALSGTFPKSMLVLDIKEKGTKTIRKTPGIQGILIKEWEKLEDVYWYLKEGKGNGRFKTVSLDQITALQDLAIDKVRRDRNMKEHEPMSQRLWGQASGLLKTWLGNFRDLQDDNMYMLFIAHQRTFGGGDEEDDNRIDPTIGARLMPSVTSYLNGAVSTIGHTFIRERFVGKGKDRIRKVEYCLRVGPHAMYHSKIRRPVEAGLLPDVIVNPTFEKIERVSRGEELSTKPKMRKK